MATVRPKHYLDAPKHFWPHVHPEPNSGCWLWSGSMSFGTPILWLPDAKVTLSARKVSVAIAAGFVGRGYRQFLSRCRMPCVNPDHIWSPQDKSRQRWVESRPVSYISYPSSANMRRLKRLAAEAVNALETGKFDGRSVSDTDRTALAKRKPSSFVVWFLYHAGVPPKHIAVVLEDYGAPGASSHTVYTAVRRLGCSKTAIGANSAIRDAGSWADLASDLFADGADLSEIARFLSRSEAQVKKALRDAGTLRA